MPRVARLGLGLLIACGSGPSDSGIAPGTVTEPPTTDTAVAAFIPESIDVTVTLDGQPTEGIRVFQGGSYATVTTDANGQATLWVDPTIPGDVVAIAQHENARTEGVLITSDTAALELETLPATDNLAYTFLDPGSPDDLANNSKCAHCHTSINADWYDSAHRTSASNPVVQDLYAGTSHIYSTESACTEAGGQWWLGRIPGTDTDGQRCYLGTGALPEVNPTCGDTGPCDTVATETAGCADCHAPAIDGELGGRNLLEAVGFAYDYGVQCDVCHKVEQVDPEGEAGVAGRLRILRPNEPGTAGLEWRALSFGPWGDSPNPRMGAVQRDHYVNGDLCMGCHELHQPVLVPGQAIDAIRWPEGRLPIHTTWSEWRDGPLYPGAPCQSCHMPPDPDVGNSADLYAGPSGASIGIASGWPRPPGSVRRHQWVGPSQPDSGMLQLAASVAIAGTSDGTEVHADVTVRNVGPGHAIPTGEPLRHMLLVVEAACDGVPLTPSGGDALPPWAGAAEVREASEGWLNWDAPEVGDRIRVVQRTGGLHDYTGPGPFGDGTFSVADKRLEVRHVVGDATVTEVNGTAITTDPALPLGDLAYRIPAASIPDALAGLPGHGFAKVLVDAAGNEMVPHASAVDVNSDNRLPPQAAWTSQHQFDESGCTTAPTVTARLLYRRVPWSLAQTKGWPLDTETMAEVTWTAP